MSRPVHGDRRPLGWLMWAFLVGAVAWAVMAMLVEDRRGPLLGLAVGFVAAGAMVGFIGGAVVRRRAAAGPEGVPTSGVATGQAATTSAFAPEPGAPAAAPVPGPLGGLATWGFRSIGRMRTVPTRMFGMFGIFFILDTAILVALAVAFPQARPGLAAGAAVLALLAFGSFWASRTIGRKLESLLGGVGDATDGGSLDLGPFVRMAERLSGSTGAGSFDVSALGAGMPQSQAPAETRAHLDRVGVAGTGTVQQVVDTGVKVSGAHVLAVTLSVTVPGKPALTSSTAAVVDPTTAARITLGATVPVRVDPANPQMVEPDWSRV